MRRWILNNGKIIKKNFDFLRKYGFKRKLFSKNTDYEVVYSKEDSIIEVSCGLNISNNNNLDIDAMIKNSFYEVWIIIQKNNKRSNIFSCDLFDELSRKKLKFEIDKIENHDIEQIVKVYSQFIMENALNIK